MRLTVCCVFCLGRACYKQTRYAFQSSRLTGVRLLAVIILQTVWWEIGGDEVDHSLQRTVEMLKQVMYGLKTDIFYKFTQMFFFLKQEVLVANRKLFGCLVGLHNNVGIAPCPTEYLWLDDCSERRCSCSSSSSSSSDQLAKCAAQRSPHSNDDNDDAYNRTETNIAGQLRKSSIICVQ